MRFGATSAHGQANMATFSFFREMGAFSRDEASGRYRVDFERMRAAVDALSERVLRLQGTGDHAGVGELMSAFGTVEADLQRDLARLSDAGIPVVVFEQGMSVLRP